jgi:predicted Zn-dependent peptidase
VVTRDVPWANGVSITLAYGIGEAQDPSGREGWTALVARTAFLSAAGEFPERTMAGLESSRPLGWRIEVGPAYTRFTEVAARAQFPGVLHEAALRLRAPAPTAKVLAEARRGVQEQLAASYHDRIPLVLHFGVRHTGEPDAAAALGRYASGRGVGSASLADVQKAIRAWYVPANAVLSLAGNLSGSGVDVARVVANEFGSIPAGTPVKPATAPRVRHGYLQVVSRDTSLSVPFGVVGIVAPALGDTAHPSFFLNAMVLGSLVTERWGRSDAVPNPFRYSLLDEPDLVRIYPPVTASDVDSSRVRQEFEEALLGASKASISVEDFAGLHDNVVWMLGGPLTPDLRRRVTADSGLLAALSSTAAMRELWGGEALWGDYLARFTRIGRPEFARWSAWYREPSHLAEMMVVPAYLVEDKKP